MTTAIIVDDEPSGINVLKNLLGRYFPDIEVIALCSNIRDAEAAIHRQMPDILFLDIEMPGGDGFQLLENIGSIHFLVVFVTAYNQYAIKALRLSATDYLLKPVNKDEVALAVEKSMQLLQFRKENPVNYAAVIANSSNNISNRILVLNKNTLEGIHFRDIACIMADSNYVVIHTIQKKQVTVAKTLKEIGELVCDEAYQFIRIHKSVIINTGQIVSVKTVAGVLFIEITNGMVHEVSKRKKTEISSILQKLKSM